MCVLGNEHGSHCLSCTVLRYTSAAQDLVMHSRGKLYEKNWKTADGKAATIDDISVFVIPLAPYKEEYTEWKQEYEAIHGIYETSCETSEGFGKLSLKTSPVATEKAVNRGLAMGNAVNTGSLYDGSCDSSASNIPSYKSDIAVNNDEELCTVAPVQGSSVLSTENAALVNDSSSNYNHDVEIRDTACPEESASSTEDLEDFVPVNAPQLCADSCTIPVMDAISQPKDPSQECSTLTQK